MRLQNNTVLITGASRGIGREIALAFAREGADLAVVSRSAGELKTLAAEVREVGRQCCVLAVDLTKPDAIDRIFTETGQTFPRVDILVNNAGLGSSANPKPVVEFDDAFWETSLRINLTVPYLLCKKVLPGMLARRFGRIINIASIAGKVGVLHGAAYAASKHGLLGLTRSLAIEVARDGITVNAICPGPSRTPMNDRRMQYDAQRLGTSIEELERSATPIGRRLDPREIGPLAVYLASQEASGVTGQAFNIDGGLVMS